MVAEHGLAPCTTTMSSLPTLLGRSFLQTLEQLADLFDTMYMRPTPFATLYNHLPGTLQRAGRNCTISLTDLQLFPHTFQQPVDLFNALYTPPTPFTIFYDHLLTRFFFGENEV